MIDLEESQKILFKKKCIEAEWTPSTTENWKLLWKGKKKITRIKKRRGQKTLKESYKENKRIVLKRPMKNEIFFSFGELFEIGIWEKWENIEEVYKHR